VHDLSLHLLTLNSIWLTEEWRPKHEGPICRYHHRWDN